MNININPTSNNSYLTILPNKNNKENSLKLFTKCQNFKSELLLILIFIVIIIVERQVRDYLHNTSFSFILYIRTIYPNQSDWIYTFSNILAHIPRDHFSFIIILISYVYMPRIDCYLITLVLFYSKFILAFLKILYQSPRPFWSNESLSFGRKYELGYGNPSGHSFRSMLYVLIIYKIILDKRIGKERKTIKTIILCLLLLYTITVGLSRIVLGVHSINQVLFGFSLGIYSFFLLFYLFNHIINIINAYSRGSLHYLLLFLPVLIIMISLLVFYSVYDQVKEEALIKHVSLIEKDASFYLFSYGTFSCLVFLISIYGFYIGILYDYMYICNQDMEKFMKIDFYYIRTDCKSNSSKDYGYNDYNIISNTDIDNEVSQTENDEDYIELNTDIDSEFDKETRKDRMNNGNSSFYTSIKRFLLLFVWYLLVEMVKFHIEVNNFMEYIVIKVIALYSLFFFVLFGPLKEVLIRIS